VRVWGGVCGRDGVLVWKGERVREWEAEAFVTVRPGGFVGGGGWEEECLRVTMTGGLVLVGGVRMAGRVLDLIWVWVGGGVCVGRLGRAREGVRVEDFVRVGGGVCMGMPDRVRDGERVEDFVRV